MSNCNAYAQFGQINSPALQAQALYYRYMANSTNSGNLVTGPDRLVLNNIVHANSWNAPASNPYAGPNDHTAKAMADMAKIQAAYAKK